MVADAAERLLPVLLVLGLAGGAVLGWRLTRRPRRDAVDETLRDLALAAAVAIILVATLLTPSVFGDDADVELVPFVDLVRGLIGRGSLRTAITELMLNVALFMPFGVALRWRLPSLGVLAVTGCALALSAGVELLQATMGGRWANSTDVITNTVGGALGAMIIGARLSRAAEG
jgi:glycopeptide antibiotics resistance protein